MSAFLGLWKWEHGLQSAFYLRGPNIQGSAVPCKIRSLYIFEVYARKLNLHVGSIVARDLVNTVLTIVQMPVLYVNLAVSSHLGVMFSHSEPYKKPIPVKIQIPALTRVLIWTCHMKAIGSEARVQSRTTDIPFSRNRSAPPPERTGRRLPPLNSAI